MFNVKQETQKEQDVAKIYAENKNTASGRRGNNEDNYALDK